MKISETIRILFFYWVRHGNIDVVVCGKRGFPSKITNIRFRKNKIHNNNEYIQIQDY